MLGNPKWFKRRKYTGWGLVPVAWQGWVYLLVLLAFVFFTCTVAIALGLPVSYQIGLIVLVLAIIVLETIHISTKIHMDERERSHGALSERNASWTMVIILFGGVIFQLIMSVMERALRLDPFVVAAILGGALVKGVSSLYYKDK